MKDGTAMFLLIVALLLMLGVAFVRIAFPREPELVIDANPATAPAPEAGPLYLLLPPMLGKPFWCAEPQGKRDPRHIERT